MSEFFAGYSFEEYEAVTKNLGKFHDTVHSSKSHYSAIRSGLISYVRAEFGLSDEVAQNAVASKKAMGETFPSSAEFSANKDEARWHVQQAFYDWVVPVYESTKDVCDTDIWLREAFEFVTVNSNDELRDYIKQDITAIMQVDELDAYILCDELDRYENTACRRLACAVDVGLFTTPEAHYLQSALTCRLMEAKSSIG